MTTEWFALQVHTGRERWVASYLASWNFNQLILLQKDVRQWSDRRKLIETPVFPGYVFCQFELEKRSSVLSAPGVLRVVGHGKTPVPIADEEIVALQKLVKTTYPVQRWPYLREGDLMRIDGGSLDGLTGRFVRIKNDCRIVVSVTLLQRSVAVEVDQSRVTPIPKSDGPAFQRNETGRGAAAASSATVGLVL
jgi:transcription antitermination factor NusG